MTTHLNVGGMYTDPFHAPTSASANLYNLPVPWFGGLRFLGRATEDAKDFVCIGCDDGIHFWTLLGEFTDATTGKIRMDFTPKAPGVGLLQCKFEGNKGALHFYEEDGTTIGNTWSRLTASSPGLELTPETKHSAVNDINGLYVDPNMFGKSENLLAGLRIISDRKGKILRDELCVVGTDDGVEWWAITGGSFTDKERGKFQMGDKIGTIKNGTIELEGENAGTKWIKMAPKMDFHSLPKQPAL